MKSAVYACLILLISTLPLAVRAEDNKSTPVKCAQIFYDRAPLKTDENYYYGRLQAVALQNLISHFPHIQQYIIPVDLYEKGQLDRCDASIYIGSYYNNSLPKDFLDDFVATPKNVAWIHYNIWQLPAEQQNKILSMSFIKLAQTDQSKTDKVGRPGVYSFFDYKGQMFERCNNFSYSISADNLKRYYNYAFAISLVKLSSPAAEKNVVSWAHYTTENKKTPFILRQKNHWYVADDVFTYICEGDRYFIFADVLFDILNEPPQEGGKKYALVRYEDVSPKQTLTKITRLADMFHQLNVPFSISLIPIYLDPFGVYNFGPHLDMQSKKNFLAALRYAQSQGANIIFHGVTHQFEHKVNPFTGVSGEDFEFWDRVNGKPMPGDSAELVLNLLDKGISLIGQSGFEVVAWVTPHYLGSFLDNTVFGRVFTWNVGRGNYGVVKQCHLNDVPIAYTYDKGKDSSDVRLARKKLLQLLAVTTLEEGNQINQIMPYPIYGDYYGRNLVPEDLGNIQPYYSTQVIAKRTVDQIINDAKRYTVLRDTWASFFIHDILLNTVSDNGIAKEPGDLSDLQRLIKAIQDDGYEFVDLNKWTTAHAHVKHLKPIEIDPPGGQCVN